MAILFCSISKSFLFSALNAFKHLRLSFPHQLQLWPYPTVSLSLALSLSLYIDIDIDIDIMFSLAIDSGWYFAF